MRTPVFIDDTAVGVAEDLERLPIGLQVGRMLLDASALGAQGMPVAQVADLLADRTFQFPREPLLGRYKMLGGGNFVPSSNTILIQEARFVEDDVAPEDLCGGCGVATALPGVPFCMTCSPEYPRGTST